MVKGAVEIPHMDKNDRAGKGSSIKAKEAIHIWHQRPLWNSGRGYEQMLSHDQSFRFRLKTVKCGSKVPKSL